MKRTLLVILVGLMTAVGLAACGSDSGDGGGAGSAECSLDALENADGVVELTFWHGLNREPEQALIALVDAFNASQDQVKVNLVNQTGYRVVFEKFQSGLGTGDLPDVIQGQEIRLQQFIDTGAALPVQACIDAEDYDTSDFVQRTIDYYTVEDEIWALPFNPSGPVFFYNKNQFRDAGLDPETPPTSLEEVRAAADALKAAGVPTPMAIKQDPWFLEQWSAKAGIEFLNNGNGRDSRATEALFDNEVGLEIFTFLRQMVDDGLAVTNQTEGQEAINNLLAVGSGDAAMTIDSTAAIGEILKLLGEGQFQNVDPGVGPLPGPVGEGGQLVGGASLLIVSQSSPEEQAAAWEFIKFATSPEQQAEFAARSGYIPVRQSAVDNPVLQDAWAAFPGQRVAYDQLLEGVENAATAGPVMGAYQAVRDIIQQEQQAMLLGQKSPEEALAAAQQGATEAIQDYNDRIGVG